MSKIVRLQSENVKRLKAVSITPAGAVVRIQGRNAQGKSSLLDSITYALGGGHVQPPKVIRDGQDHARVVLELEDMVIERRWTAKGTYLEVRSHAGAKFPSPQALLDKLVGSLSFDPLAFTRMEAKKQVETLRALVGIDFTGLDQKRQETFDARTLVNREVTGLKAQLDRTPPPIAGTPKEEVSVSDLVQEQQALLATKAANDEVRRQLAAATARVTTVEEGLSRARATVEELRARLADAEATVGRGEKALAEAQREASALDMQVDGMVDPDLAGVTERIRNVEQTNATIRKARERRDLEAKLLAKAAEAEKLTIAIATVDAEKQKALAEAAFPVPGLSFSADGITLNGIPLEQASAAEQLRVSLAMGLALNPKLKVMLIRDGSLLDETSLRIVQEMAEAADAQVWLEVVGTAGDVGVVIEDGEARGPEAETAVEMGGAA